MPGFDLMVSHVYQIQKIKPEDRQDIYMDLLTTLNLDGYYMRGQNRVVVLNFPLVGAGTVLETLSFMK